MEFHLIVNGKQEGPFTIEELSQKGLNPESEVWAPGMADWMQAGDVPELTAVLQRAEFEASQQAARAAENQATMGQPYNPVTPPSYVPPQVPNYGPPAPVKRKNGCMPWLLAGVILAILFTAMVFTCPTREDHEDAVTTVTKQWATHKIQQGVGELTGNSGAGRAIIQLILNWLENQTDSAVKSFVSSNLDVDNYVVCSVGRVSVGDAKDKMVSFGVFGHVFTFGEDDLEKVWLEFFGKNESNISVLPPSTSTPDTLPSEEDEDQQWDEEAVADSIMGMEVPPEVDTLVGEAIRMAKEWAKRQIDELGN